MRLLFSNILLFFIFSTVSVDSLAFSSFLHILQR
jgi:hypothetical protein